MQPSNILQFRPRTPFKTDIMKEPITARGVRSTFEIIGDRPCDRNGTGYLLFEAIGTREQIEELAREALRRGILGSIG